jgi:hypothetical protein
MNDDGSWNWWAVILAVFISVMFKGLWNFKLHYDVILKENITLKTQLQQCQLSSELKEAFKDILKK